MNHQLNEERCPVADHLLGKLYEASPHGVGSLIESVPQQARARLAVYCYRRAHLSSIGLAVAASCDEQSLVDVAGNAGADLFAKSRTPEFVTHATYHERRRVVTLAGGIAS